VRISGWSVGAAALAVAAGALGLGRAAPAQPSSNAEDLLTGARTASEHASYAGALLVTWQDHGQVHTTETYAQVDAGVVDLGAGDNRVLSRDGQRWLAEPGGWTLVLGPDASAATPPLPDAHWDLRSAPGPVVAEQPTVEVDAADPATGATRARFFIDRATGTVLRRDLLDAHGGLLREIGFAAVAPVGAALPTPPPQRAAHDEPRPLTAVPSGDPAPSTVGRGYDLLGQYRQPDGSVQVAYGDGLFTLSLFEQPGSVDWDAMPAGDDARLHGVQTRTYTTPTTTAVVWGVHGVVITCVSDAPPDQVQLAVKDVVGGGNESSVGDQIARFVLGPFGWD
jgi:negative regulator of sigma E activity